ncbi:MAG: cysteine--tRNA ligase [Alphaproteobacteria bacterium]|nr:cysteine--tRNA ligase [Alphaproteobacteria bacterium]
MPITLYNSLTRRKEVFRPLDPSRVRMYVCGPTVYDLAHIGNARAVVAFDVLYRLLRQEYGAEHVRYVRNITDVEDKIIAAARERGEPIEDLTRRTTAIFHADMAALGNMAPDAEPRATEYIPQMIAMIERLIASGHAYAAQGHALFRIASHAGYGALSGRSRDEMIAGARIEVAPYKEDPGDFVLWKPSSPEQPGWDSPWGRGRPGWHIECSAMSEAELGESFDIHGGGIDLIFPHHENEMAQSVCAHDGRNFVNFWVHNGFLTVNGAKMAKSEGNFVTVRELLEKGVPGEAIRFALLSTHYRDPLDWTEDKLHWARQTLDRFYRALNEPSEPGSASEPGSRPASPDDVRDAVGDDLNTPLGIARLHELARDIYRTEDRTERGRLQAALAAGGRLLGILLENPCDWIRAGSEKLVAYIDQQIMARALARRERRFADADRIRSELAQQNIVLEDRPDGTTDWRSA